MIPRPVRNNNPGDLQHVAHGTDWAGQLSARDMTPAQKAEPRFVVFASPEMGFRALVILLHNYQTLFKCGNIYEVVARFAPASENPTAQYAAHVAWECGVDVKEPFDLTIRANMFKLAKAMTKFETGSWHPYWTDSQLELAIGLTGYFPAEQLELVA